MQDEAEADLYPEAVSLGDGKGKFSRPDSVDSCVTEDNGDNIITYAQDMQAAAGCFPCRGGCGFVRHFDIFIGSDP